MLVRTTSVTAALMICLLVSDARCQTTVSEFGSATYTRFGADFDVLGDVNGDSYPDLVSVGILGALITGDKHALVVSGKDGATLQVLTPPIFGRVRRAGDVNQDGVPDYLTSTQPPGGGPGDVLAVSGSDGSIIHAVPPSAAAIYFGNAFAPLGDIDGDGRDDFAAASGDFFVQGSVGVYSGASAALLYTKSGTALFDNFGVALDVAGDIDADGFVDLIVGASGQLDVGTASLFRAADGTPLTQQFGTANFSSFGWAVAGAGDFDQDGFDDYLVGAPGSTAPAVHLFSGQAGSLLTRLDDPFFTNTSATSGFGSAVAASDDIDGDGLRDIIVGAPFAPTSGTSTNPGAVQVRSGTTGLLRLSFYGSGTVDSLGTAVRAFSDVTGDGLGEFLAAAPRADIGGAANGGIIAYSKNIGSMITTLDVGCAGASGVIPKLTLTEVPGTPAQLHLTLEQAPPSAPALLFLSASPGVTTLPVVCQLYTAALAPKIQVVFSVPASGTVTFVGPVIPQISIFIAQIAVADPASPGSIAMTRAQQYSP